MNSSAGYEYGLLERFEVWFGLERFENWGTHGEKYVGAETCRVSNSARLGFVCKSWPKMHQVSSGGRAVPGRDALPQTGRGGDKVKG